MRIRLITWNVHKGVGGADRKYRPERIVEVLAHYRPDIVLLQEVSDGASLALRHDQVHYFGDALGFRHRMFHANVRMRRGGHYGNAILSRFVPTETRIINLTFPGTKRRGVLHARFRVRSPHGGEVRTLHVYNLHLGLTERLRRAQMGLFLTSRPFGRLDPRAPVVVAGDFNDVWGTIGRKMLVPCGFRGPERRVKTFPACAPVMALDAIFVRGGARLLRWIADRPPAARWASDHLPVAAEIRIG